MNSPPVHRSAIVIAINDRFVAPAQALLESIRQRGGQLRGLTLVVLATDLTAQATATLDRAAAEAGLSFEVRIIPDLSDLGVIPDWAVTWCLRLYLGDECLGFERALYLDSDMVVLHPLAPLIDVEMGDYAAAAVKNHPPFDQMRIAIPRSRRRSVGADVPYFNAGVFLIDVDRWMRRSVGQQCREYLRQNPATRIPDQDSLNMALAGDWQPLEKAWNTPAGPLDQTPGFAGLAQISGAFGETLRQWREVQATPKILHFTGHPKPWEDSYPWPDLKRQYYGFVLPAFGTHWPSSRNDDDPEADTDRRRLGFPRVST